MLKESMAVNGLDQMDDDLTSTPAIPLILDKDVKLAVGKAKVIGCNRLYVRAKPGRKFKKLLTLNRGDEVTLVDYLLNGWTSIMTETGIEGYVFDTFIEKV